MLKWDKLEGKIIKDRYEIQGIIGKGGGGRVYLAFDRERTKQVAIKTSNPNQTMSNYKERFHLEAKSMSKLVHPNIVGFFEFLEIDGTQMIVMEYIEGISLHTKLSKNKSINQKDALRYTREILSALKEVHSHKIFHRDIKPDNIHITIDGTVKLIDFGIVQEAIDQDLTRQGSVIGTISYLAPELITSPYKKANERTDIYSLGVMLYQLLTGVKPFNPDAGLLGAEKNNNLAQKIATDPVLPANKINSNISDSLNHFVMKLIEREPGDRYQNTKDALIDIDKIISGGLINSLQGYYKEETKDYLMNKKMFIIAGIILAILFSLIIAILLIVFI